MLLIFSEKRETIYRDVGKHFGPYSNGVRNEGQPKDPQGCKGITSLAHFLSKHPWIHDIIQGNGLLLLEVYNISRSKKSDQDRWVSVGRTWEEHQVKDENIPRGCVLKDRLQIFEREKEIEQSKVVYIVGWRWRASSAKPHSRLKRLDLHDERDGAQDWITKGFSHQEIVRRITGKKESETRNNGKSNIAPTTAMPSQQK